MSTRTYSQRSRSLAAAVAVTATAALLLSGPVPQADASSAVTVRPHADDDPRPVLALDETPPRFDDEEGGNANADDPAIWVGPGDGSTSFFLGTLKNGGLEVYDLRGRMLQHIDTPPPPEEGLEAGRFNNVDLLQDVEVDGLPTDLAVVTDRGRDRLRIYSIDTAGAAAADGRVLTDVTVDDAPRLFSKTEADVEDQETGYGLALRRDADGQVWAAVSRRHRTTIGAFHLVSAGGGRVSYERGSTVRVRDEFTLPDGGTWSPCEEPGEGPQVEGMVVDRRTDVLYAAQEDVGVWRIPFTATGFGKPRLAEKVKEYSVPAEWNPDTEECEIAGDDPGFGGSHLSADAEGLTIAYGDSGKARLLASSQGDSTFSIFGLRDARLRWTDGFEVIDGPHTDGVQDCDGAAVVTTPIGSRYPHGLLVLHDGDNTPIVEDPEGNPRVNTNFKLLRWDEVAGAVG